MRNKGNVMGEMSRRFHARVRSNPAFAETLSNVIAQYVQSVRAKSGDLNVKFPYFSAKRGAPPGNGNRLVHGFRTREWDQFRKEVREHIASSAAQIAALDL